MNVNNDCLVLLSDSIRFWFPIGISYLWFGHRKRTNLSSFFFDRVKELIIAARMGLKGDRVFYHHAFEHLSGHPPHTIQLTLALHSLLLHGKKRLNYSLLITIFSSAFSKLQNVGCCQWLPLSNRYCKIRGSIFHVLYSCFDLCS